MGEGKRQRVFASKEFAKYNFVQTDSNVWCAFSSEPPVKLPYVTAELILILWFTQIFHPPLLGVISCTVHAYSTLLELLMYHSSCIFTRFLPKVMSFEGQVLCLFDNIVPYYQMQPHGHRKNSINACFTEITPAPGPRC